MTSPPVTFTSDLDEHLAPTGAELALTEVSDPERSPHPTILARLEITGRRTAKIRWCAPGWAVQHELRRGRPLIGADAFADSKSARLLVAGGGT